jgi:hypothetical protein
MENKWTYRRNPRPEGDCGLNPTGINPGADVDADGRITMAELIYILQEVAGLR